MKEQLADRIGKLNEDLKLEKYVRDGVLVIYCQGAFSLVSHAQLDRLLGEVRGAKERRIVLDLRETGHIDSTGLGTLAMSLKHCMAAKRELALVPNDAVRRLLASSALDTVFSQFDSVDAALAWEGPRR
jgi:anti-anti-sigma factor